ncbi:MAG: 1-acyl-sn-glycerol-3-phosphate acyltransferase [Planctomycetes bacterium]|nr:1-acyl-sn-glycerol-3-phosphate acyltransferase [Planctomycetota bacterium]
MQETIVEKPYKFVSAKRGTWFPRIVRNFQLFNRHLRKTEGVIGFEVRHAERLKESLASGHAILLTPNHCRTADPLVLGWMCGEVKCVFYCMASWHLYNMGWFVRWFVRSIGCFSVNRDGVDRQAVKKAIEVLRKGERPLIIFPEVYTSRRNDRLQTMMDGLAFIARTAAKKRAKEQNGKVILHPIAIKYSFQGDLHAAIDPVLDGIEQRLTFQSEPGTPLLDRIDRVRNAFVCLKELEHFGAVQSGDLGKRQEDLTAKVLASLEEKWLITNHEKHVVPRVKAIRSKIVPELANDISGEERAMRWRDIFHVELAHHLSCWSPDYLAEWPSIDRIFETIDRIDQHLNGKPHVHENLKAIIDIGEPLEVPAWRDRKTNEDPLMTEVARRLQDMLTALGKESRLYEPDSEVSG